MHFGELFMLAAGLSMDAFAVAICKGLSICRLRFRDMVTVGLYFGFFQALMPFLGYCLGSTFSEYIISYDHWVAFVLLLLIGGNMIFEGLRHGNDDCCDASLRFRDMILLAVATSIDALAIGITLSFLQVHIGSAVTFIGVITFVLSMAGVKIGNLFGMKYKSGAEILGGVVLICIGGKILLEHLGVLN